MNWQEIARACAREAHEEFFSSRWGVRTDEDNTVIVVFSNNFYKNRPTLQDEERAYLRERFGTENVPILGEATWPVSGPDDAYTYAMVLDAAPERKELVASILGEAINRSLRLLSGER
jgi:hypothetical protein